MSSCLSTKKEGDLLRLAAHGDWRVPFASEIDKALCNALEGIHGPKDRVELELSDVARLDTSGAWLVLRTEQILAKRNIDLRLLGLSAPHCDLLKAVRSAQPCPPVPSPRRNRIVLMIENLGEATISSLNEAANMISFLGAIVLAFVRLLIRPWRVRLTSITHHIEMVGVNAIPIVALLSFLIGVVLAYQAADQLAQFGVEIFAVNLLGISILRELGILLTAIIVAGRSGSAFTAEIGTMKVNEEVAAMQVIGVDPIEVLVLPRLIALMIALPLLAFVADIMALAGGAIVIIFGLEIPTIQFFRQLQLAVDLETFVLGMIKAPVFAFLIAMVGCYEGMRVEGSAESVGRLTTQSVVISIFLVIVVNALFSVLYQLLGFSVLGI